MLRIRNGNVAGRGFRGVDQLSAQSVFASDNTAGDGCNGFVHHSDRFVLDGLRVLHTIREQPFQVVQTVTNTIQQDHAFEIFSSHVSAAP